MSTEKPFPQATQNLIAARFKARRLSMNLSQEGLALRSGVNWSSLKRFEHKGLIAFDSLLKLALILNCLDDFGRICIDASQTLTANSLDEILTEPRQIKRGRLK